MSFLGKIRATRGYMSPSNLIDDNKEEICTAHEKHHGGRKVLAVAS